MKKNQFVMDLNNKVKSLGQYFTPENIAKFMCTLITKPKNAEILEPCAGKGVFLQELSALGFANITAYEIDETLLNESKIDITYSDFLTVDIDKKFDVIIGNPPYVRWKNIDDAMKNKLLNSDYWKDVINGLSDILYAFIYRCIELLKPNGELIFITPSYWMNTLHSNLIRKKLIENGILDLIIDFKEMKIFDKVASSIIIFKFSKSKEEKSIKVLNISQKKKAENELLDKLNELLKNLDKEPYIKLDKIEALTFAQFKNSNPWQPLPEETLLYISKIEKACEKNPPLVDVVLDGKPMKKKLTQMFNKENLRSMNIPLEKCKKVRFAKSIYYIIHPDNLISDFTNATRKMNHRYINLGDIAEIGNGMVSGLDKAFRMENTEDILEIEQEKLISVVKAEGMDKYFHFKDFSYIFVNDIEKEVTLKKEYPNFFEKIHKHKSKLDQRYKYNREIPWWHWVFLRNKKLMENNKEKIFVPCKERFDSKWYVRFSLVKGDYYATQDTTIIVKKKEFKESIKYILAILNSHMIFTWLKHKGLKRGGVLEFSELPLSRIPIRLIDWTDKEEVALYNHAIQLVDDIILEKNYANKKKALEDIILKLYALE